MTLAPAPFDASIEFWAELFEIERPHLETFEAVGIVRDEPEEEPPYHRPARVIFQVVEVTRNIRSAAPVSRRRAWAWR